MKLPWFFFVFLIFSFSLHSIEVEDWTEIKPGGETRCAHGGEFSFLVHEGDPNKVVIDFMGGGACWNKKTCKKGSITFIESIEEFKKRSTRKKITGIYDKKNDKNPLKDWTHIIIPYCTGDIHIGENDYIYGNGMKKFVINHRGATNSKAVLKFVEEKYKSPDKILLTGCSAGAYGSFYWVPHVKKIYPASKIFQFGDSGAGVITKSFYREHAKKNWDLWKNVPAWIPRHNLEKEFNILDLYREYGDYFPDVRFSQFNYRKDFIQKKFFQLMGGRPSRWSGQMIGNMNWIDSPLDNFNFYLNNGNKHCVLLYPRFYKTKVGGVSLGDWIKKLVNDEPLENRVCKKCSKKK